MQNRNLIKENEDLKKGETGIEQKIKALNDMNSQKVKALLRSIQNLKKDLAKEKQL